MRKDSLILLLGTAVVGGGLFVLRGSGPDPVPPTLDDSGDRTREESDVRSPSELGEGAGRVTPHPDELPTRPPEVVATGPPAEREVGPESEAEAWEKKYTGWSSAMLSARAKALLTEVGEEVSRRVMEPETVREVGDLGSSKARIDLSDVLEGQLRAVVMTDGRTLVKRLPERGHPGLYVLRREAEWLEGRARE